MLQHGLLAAYLVVGVDRLKRETVTHRLKKRLEPGLEAFNLDERDAMSIASAEDLLLSLNTIPVGNGFRLVLIHDAGKLPKQVSEGVVGYLANPNPDCVLCLDAENLPKGTRLYKAVAAVGKQSVIRCDAIKTRDFPSFVVKLARPFGITVHQDAARELVSRVGEDTTLLERTIRTLGEQCGPTIQLADVEANVARTADVKPWEFLDKVAAGDSRRALELYRHMPNPSHLALLSLITRNVRELICARSLMDRGQQSRVASELHKQEWQVRSVVRAAQRFDAASLACCLERCAKCERELKSGADAETSFVGLVLYVCGAGRGR